MYSLNFLMEVFETRAISRVLQFSFLQLQGCQRSTPRNRWLGLKTYSTRLPLSVVPLDQHNLLTVQNR